MHSGTARPECGNHLLCESRVVFLSEQLISNRSKESGGVGVLETGPSQAGWVCLLNQLVVRLDRLVGHCICCGVQCVMDACTIS